MCVLSASKSACVHVCGVCVCVVYICMVRLSKGSPGSPSHNEGSPTHLGGTLLHGILKVLALAHGQALHLGQLGAEIVHLQGGRPW